MDPQFFTDDELRDVADLSGWLAEFEPRSGFNVDLSLSDVNGDVLGTMVKVDGSVRFYATPNKADHE